MTVLADPNGPLDDTGPAISDALGELERGEGPLGREPSPDEWIRRLGTLPLVYQPGERWMYHTAANVTGVLIARATGMSFGDALRGDATDEIVVEDGPDGYWSKPPAFEEGGSGLVSTASDHLAFASALLAGGTHHGERTLSRPSITLMTSHHLTPAQKAVSGFSPGDFDDIGWGFGMSVRTRRTHLGPSVGSYGPSRGHDDNPHDAAGA
jgi:CubicO group peptidase (beta-lactamase class C family)